jgi:D-arginine dehydrogenase
MTVATYDYVVIGAGIAGASAAYELAVHGRTLLVERESQPGYHSTGRSAALFTETYGNAVIRGLAIASRRFLEQPPPGFAEHPLLTPRGVLMIARRDQSQRLAAAFTESHRIAPSVRRVEHREALAACPALRPDYLDSAFYEPEARDMDVHAIHQGFLRGYRARGGTLTCGVEVNGLAREGGSWRLDAGPGALRTAVVINAAGAWADEIARRAGVRGIGLVPKRRTAITVDAPGFDFRSWPSVIDIDEEFYLKPDAGQLILSPADETPVAPQDVQPEEIDIAHCIDRVERATTLRIQRVGRKWAGLRSFVRDKTLVAGFAADAPGFFWLAGQGGYGIMTSPAMGRIAAALANGRPMPGDIESAGVTASDLSPERLHRTVPA